MLNNRRLLSFSLTFLLGGISAATNISAQTGKATGRLTAEKKEIDAFVLRWNAPENKKLVDSAKSALTDDNANRERADLALHYLSNFSGALEEYQNRDLSALDYVGGLKAYKKTAAGWLTDPVQSVRGAGAVLLGVSGDPSFAPQLSVLFQDATEPDADNPRYDRGRAATALGMIGAKQFTRQLADRLSSPNESDRGGAALGLGFLKAKKYELAIGRLVHDKNVSVEEAAADAIEIMNGNATAAAKTAN